MRKIFTKDDRNENRGTDSTNVTLSLPQSFLFTSFLAYLTYVELMFSTRDSLEVFMFGVSFYKWRR